MRGDFEGAAAALDEALRRLRSAGLEVPPDVMEELVWNGIGRRDFTGAARWQARRSEAQPDNTTQAKLLVMLEAATGNHDRQLGLFQRLSAQTAGPAPPVQKADTAVLILASAPPGAPTEVLETATTLAGEASAAGAGFGATLCEALGHLQLGRSDRAAELCLPMTQNQSWPVRAAASAVAARVLAALGQEEDAVRLAAGCRELLDRTPASAERGVYRDWVLDTLLFTELVLRDGGE